MRQRREGYNQNNIQFSIDNKRGRDGVVKLIIYVHTHKI